MRTTVKPTCLAILALTACALSPTFAQAHRVQGFETGDPNDYTFIGDAGKLGAFQVEATPSEGSNQFLLTTIGMSGNEDMHGPVSGSFAVTNTALQTFFNGIGLSGFEGSGILIPFTVLAGDTGVSFDYDFLSNEPFSTPQRNDFAFAAIFNGRSLVPNSFSTVANVTTANLAPFGVQNQSPFIFHTGYESKFLSFSLAPGTYFLGIGVDDAGSFDHASGLLIDNVQVVPEPSVVALTVAGAGMMLAMRRRIKRA